MQAARLEPSVDNPMLIPCWPNRFCWTTTLACVAAAASLIGAAQSEACPFCTVESRTLTEEITSSDGVMLAKLVAEAPELDMEADDAGGFGPADPDSGKATFQIVEVLRGPDAMAADQQIKVVYYGEAEPDRTFLISGIAFED